MVGEYERAGYRACWHSGEPHERETIYRLATFHLDRINLAPLQMANAAAPIPLMTVLQSTVELAVPDWVEQALDTYIH